MDSVLRFAWLQGGILSLAISSTLLAIPTQAQNITSAGDGTGTTVHYNAASQTYTINGGTQIDANLFHSFQQFGLSTGEIANFLANPNVANVLARVTGGQTSVIDGLLQVSGGNNANLFILNPAGVLLGRNANLNLSGSFSVSTASGLSFENEVFNATGSNDYSALTGDPTGYVFLGNEGVLLNEADLAVNPGQGITLAGNTVINTGSLTAPEGSVSIVALPEEGILKISQSGLILSLAIPTDPLNGLVESGITPLDLPGLLAGEWGGNANTVSTLPSGTVVLSAGDLPVNTDPGTVTVADTVDVSGGEGGQVQVFGENIALTAATIDADGTNGGGSVLVGGEYLGQGDLPTALTTTVDRDSVISANAATNGDGGRVVVWADDSTTFSGNIFARGGTLSGDGGFVETSGAQTLTFVGGLVDASAPYGRSGLWLLDPADITIGAGEATAIETALGIGTSVELTTVGTGGSSLGNINPVNPGNGDIRLEESINAVATNNAVLTLTAFRNVSSSGSATISVANGGLVLNLNQDSSSGTYATSVINNALALIGTVSDGAVVNLGVGTYQGDTIILNNANTAINLVGAAEGTTLSGENTRRVLLVNEVVTIEDLTVSNGFDSSTGGAGIRFSGDGNLTLNNNIFSDNNARGTILGGRGGGIYFSSTSGNLTLNSNIFSGNTASASNTSSTDSRGGGISFSGTFGNLILNRNTFSDNVVDGGGHGSAGGGIHFVTNFGSLIINESLFSNNAADNISSSGLGGGIYARGGGGNATVTVNNSTFSSNTAETGGGIHLFSSNGVPTLTVSNSTLSNNTANNAGGGIYFRSNNGDLFLRNSVVSGNSASSFPEVYVNLGLANSNNNLFGISGISGVSFPLNTAPGTADSINPLPLTSTLYPLADNGGPTYTHALVAGSSAIDASGTGALPNDQRGLAAVGNRDIGAFEFGAVPNLVVIDGNNQSATVDTAFPTPLQVQIQNAAGDPYQWGSDITFAAPNIGASVTSTNQAVTPDADSIASFSATANTTAGNFLVSATSPGLTGVNFNLTNNPGAATAVALATAGGDNQSTTVNTAFTDALQVSLVDAFGNNVSTSGTTVTFTAPGSGASLDAVSQTALTDTSGIASLNATANTTAGNFTVTASSTGLTDTSFSLTNTPDVANQFTVAGFASPVTAGTSDAFTVTALDQFGNTATGYSGTVGFTSSDSHSSVALPSNSTLTNGVGNFNATLVTAGSQSITATDTVTNSLNGSQTGITVNAAAASNLAISGGNTQSTTVNTAFGNDLQIVVTDAFGNAVSGIDVVLTTPSTGAGASTGNTTLTTDGAGQASTTATANTIAGNFTVTASSTGLTDVSFSLTNIPDVANGFTVAGFTNPITAGTSETFTVTATDQFGNTATSYSGTVGFSSSDSHSSVALPGNSTLTNGVGNFNATLVTAGSQSITATDTVASSIIGSQTGIMVNAAAASNLAIANGNNQDTTVNTAFGNDLQVAVTDTFGNAVPGINVTLSAPSAGAGANLSNTILTTDASGLATTTATANTIAGSYQVGATATGLTGVNFDLTNTAGPATGLALIGGNNQNTTVNTAFSSPLQVRLIDAFGNNVSTPGTSITFTAPNSGASLDSANQTATTNASGIATTNATANTVAGDFQVGVTAAGLTGINLNLTNTPGAPSALSVVGGNNQSTAVNTAFTDSLVVNLMDAFNNPIPNAAIAFNAPSTGASLTSATQTATTDSNGVAAVTAISNADPGNFTVQAQSGPVSTSFNLENTAGSTPGPTLGGVTVTPLDTSIDTDTLFNRRSPLEIPQPLGPPILVIDPALAEEMGLLDWLNEDGTLIPPEQRRDSASSAISTEATTQITFCSNNPEPIPSDCIEELY